jgi:hypothetical protein
MGNMMSNKTKSSDDGNMGFGFRAHVVHHKPGFDHGGPEREPENGNHRLHRSEQKDIPQGSLAERLSQPKKGA